MPKNIREDGTPPSIDDQAEELGIKIWDGVQFQFDPTSFQFVIGDTDSAQRLSPTDLLDAFALNQLIYKEQKPVDLESEGYLYMILSGSLVQMPIFRRQLALLSADDQEKATILQETKTIIRDVYENIEPSVRLPRFNPREKVNNSFMFNADIDSNGLFRIQTLGNCACLSRDPDGYGVFVPQLYPSIADLSIPLVYGRHNTDKRVETVSLLAGAGALSYFVSNRQITPPK